MCFNVGRYVRIGNGNQLIRDPKKRTRKLASEKVRWSLHTARLRLAKKRTYCQFFTRFGKCNKDDGKCPYIHDPSKIAVCTKFLNGLCSNPNCKLTHKVNHIQLMNLMLSNTIVLYLFVDSISGCISHAGHSRKNAGLFLLFARCFLLKCAFVPSIRRHTEFWLISLQVYAPTEIVLIDM